MAASTLDLVKLPWLFAQQQPLDTSAFCRAAKTRGVDLDNEALRELWRHRLLVPFYEIRSRRTPFTSPPAGDGFAEPIRAGTHLMAFRFARRDGRLVDPALRPFPRGFDFEPPSVGDRHLWNGLLYSPQQLLVLPQLERILTTRRLIGRPEQRRVRITPPPPFDVEQAARARTLAVAVTAIESRYRPVLETDWLRLSNAEAEEWEAYREGFDPVAVMRLLAIDASAIKQIAEGLLLRAKHLDDLGPWSKLLRQAPPNAWEKLSGRVAQMMDQRVAAEMLMLWYEDLVQLGEAPPLDLPDRQFWSFASERLSYSSETLDETLSSLGISPHPGVVLIVEGPTERFFVRQIADLFEFRRTPDIMQVLDFDGNNNRDLTRIAVLAAAPLLAERESDDWRMVRPPTRLVILSDPENDFKTPELVEKKKRTLLREIRSAVQAQGADPAPEDLESLVEIHTWDGGCFEFAHFTDAELADALFEVHPNCSGQGREALVSVIGRVRRSRPDADVEAVWKKWSPDVKKTVLAKALWPVMQQKIHKALNESSTALPEIAIRTEAAYRLALSRPSGHWILRQK